ncbi:MAG TPA: hypothetical protein PLK40_00945 [Bacteroidaceae bacterium]|nr:hypothetical protein [Bacteroidaceae bacterium]
MNNLKYIGLVLVLIGALMLIVAAFTGSAAINNNSFLGWSVAAIVIGLAAYVVLGKQRIDA